MWSRNFSVYSIALTPRNAAPKIMVMTIHIHLRLRRRAGLRRAHAERHRQRADDQDDGVQRAPEDVQVVAGLLECRRRGAAVDQVRHEQPAEEHDLGDEEHPHAERRRLGLLLHVVEVVLQLRVVRVLVVPVPARRVDVHRRLCGSDPESALRARDPQTMPTSCWGVLCVPCVTIGVTAKFSVGGGEGISHSSPWRPRDRR